MKTTNIGYLAVAAAAAFTIGLMWNSQSQAQANAPQRFSYAVLYERNPKTLEDELSKAGAQGWELVAVVPPPSETAHVRYILKRAN